MNNSSLTNQQNESIAEAANRVASRHAFTEYQNRKSSNTTRRQKADLYLFKTFLKSAKMEIDDLYSRPEEWRNITWGLVKSFLNWQLQQGYAIDSVNVRLATVKRYAELAAQAGYITPEGLIMIKTVKGFHGAEKVHIDEKRDKKRVGKKKAQSVTLNNVQVQILKNSHEDTPQGHRDRLMMCLFLDLGLRAEEMALLTAGAFDLDNGTVTFYRPKVNKTQIHNLTDDCIKAMQVYKSYMSGDPNEPLLRGSLKNGQLTHSGLLATSISDRVHKIGKDNGINLRAHDGRHTWATRASREGANILDLQEAGGWNSLAMPRRYIEQSEIANQGIVKGKEGL